MYFRIWFRFCEVSLSSVMPIVHHIKIIIITFFIVICLLKWELAYPGLHRPLWRKKNFGQKIIHCFLRMTKTNPIKNWNFFICKLRKWPVYFQFRVCYIESKVKKIFETIFGSLHFFFHCNIITQQYSQVAACNRYLKIFRLFIWFRSHWTSLWSLSLVGACA